MIAKDTSGNGDFEITPAGLHQAVCYGVIDLGTQFNPVYSTEQRKCIILWELPDVTIDLEDGPMPRAISKMYTVSLSSKAHLRNDLEGWRGRKFSHQELENGFELKKLLGINCQLNVVHNYSEKHQKEFANVGSIVPLSKGMQSVKSVNEHIYWSFDDGGEMPDMPEWIMNIIMKSSEYNEGPQMQDEGYYENQEPSIHGPEDPDDIPF